MSIWLQKLASIQPRTGLVKFARSPCTDLIISLVQIPPGSVRARPRLGRGEHARRRLRRALPREHRGGPLPLRLPPLLPAAVGGDLSWI